MTAAEYSVGSLVLLPLLASAVSVLLPVRGRRLLALLVVFALAGFTALVAVQTAAGEVVELALGGYSAPLGIHLRADGLSVLFVGLTTLVGGIVTVFAVGSKTTHEAFWPLWLGCWAGLNAVFISGDLFNSYVGLELVGLTAVALVALGGRPAWSGALRYLFIAVLGSLLFLVGVGIVVSAAGTLDIEQAGAALQQNPELAPALTFALVLMTVGLGMKVALLPMHAWLIPAHSAAPSAVSPLLSALVIKAALFVLLRCWMWLAAGMPELAPLAWTLGVLGATAVIVGSIAALRQDALKRLIAYSTVAQIGYWFLAFPLLGAEMDDDVRQGAFGGILALALGHGVAKAGLFLAAGSLKDTYGSDDITVLHGAGRKQPLVVMGMGLTAVGLMGLPISLGFTGKWQVATSAVGAQQWWILAVLMAGTLLSAAYLVRAIAPLLLMESPEPDAASVSRNFRSVSGITVLSLGVLTLATGFGGVVIDAALQVGSPW